MTWIFRFIRHQEAVSSGKKMKFISYSFGQLFTKFNAMFTAKLKSSIQLRDPPIFLKN
jgi:hypothetical protein